MFNAVKKVRLLATSVVRPKGLILTIFLILSLIADGAAQSSSQTASTVSQAASAASQVASAASQASLQASSQAGSQSPSQTLAQTGSQASETLIPSSNDITASIDDSCTPDLKDAINQALKDSLQMVLDTVKDKTDHKDDSSSPEIWGPGSEGNVTFVHNRFEQFAQNPPEFQGRCSLDNTDSACSSPLMIGGIGESGPDERRDSGARLVFCGDYFKLSTLDHQVQRTINHPTDVRSRYNLGIHHENQATTLLRTLLHYLPQSDDLNWPLLDLWVYASQKSGVGIVDRWSACYGIFCAKVLARVNDGVHDWASVNADNYALFALSKYLAPRIGGKFAFLPEVAEKGFGYNELAVPFSGDDGASILLSEFFSQRTVSQPNYNVSRLQPDKSIHIENLLRSNQKADITRMPYVKNMPDSPGTQKNLQSFNAFGEIYMDQLVNKDASYDLTCFGKDSDKHPYAKDFDGNKAVEFAGQFCEDIIKTWDVATPVPPTVRDTSDFRNASRVYSLEGTNPESHLGFFAVADPALYIQPRNIRQFFEGATDEAKIDHCRLTYKDIIRGCDTDATKRRGGVLKLNDRLYGVYTTPDDREGNLPWLTDYVPLGDLKCSDYNHTSYWRIATSIEGKSDTKAPVDITETERLRKICSCWYSAFPFTSDLFCKRSAPQCGDLETDDKRKAAVWDKFACKL